MFFLKILNVKKAVSSCVKIKFAIHCFLSTNKKWHQVKLHLKLRFAASFWIISWMGCAFFAFLWFKLAHISIQVTSLHQCDWGETISKFILIGNIKISCVTWNNSLMNSGKTISSSTKTRSKNLWKVLLKMEDKSSAMQHTFISASSCNQTETSSFLIGIRNDSLSRATYIGEYRWRAAKIS